MTSEEESPRTSHHRDSRYGQKILEMPKKDIKPYSRTFSRQYQDERAEKNRYEQNRMKSRRPSKTISIGRRESGDSDFRSHLIFDNIVVPEEHEHEFMEALIAYINHEIGEVSVAEGSSKDGYTRCQFRKLAVSIGFKYDRAALNYLDMKPANFRFKDSDIMLEPKISKSFKYFMVEAQRIRREEDEERREEQRREQERRRREDKYRRARDDDRYQRTHYGRRRQYSSQRSNSRSRSRSRRRSYSASRSRSHRSHRRRSQSNEKINYQVLRIFGIPLHIHKKQVLDLIERGVDRNARVQADWESISKCEYLKVRLQQRDARSLFNFLDSISSRQREMIPLIIRCNSEEISVRRALAEHQVKITFERSVHPLNLYKALSSFGRVVQMSVQNRQNRSYIVTYSSLRVAKSIKTATIDRNLMVSVAYVDSGQLIYRPSRKNRLDFVMGMVKNNDRGYERH